MDEKERKSCIFTIKTLMNLAYNIHGVMDVVDVDNCKKIIEMLDSGYLAGRWIPTYEDCCADVWVKWKCSECGYVRKKGWKQTYDGAKPDALFCEMCNADMRGEQE